MNGYRRDPTNMAQWQSGSEITKELVPILNRELYGFVVSSLYHHTVNDPIHPTTLHYRGYFTAARWRLKLPMMKLNALLMCRNQASLGVLAEALDSFEIEHEVHVSSEAAMEVLARGYYSAVILDFDVPGAAQVAQLARLAAPHRRPVVFAMIGGLTAIGSVLQSGANFVLYKPLTEEQVTRSLRAARGFLRPDRRRSARHKTTTLAHLAFGETKITVIALEVSEQALSLQAPEPLPAVPFVTFHFLLPGTNQAIEGSGEMLWADDTGRAGMLFSELTPASRKRLRGWLSKQGGHKKTPKVDASISLPARAARRSPAAH